MDFEGRNFGAGPRENAGASDLIKQYKLQPHHEFFCKKSLPLSISETYYLHNVVGDTEIRKGEGMELGQLLDSNYSSRDHITRIQPIELDLLREAFQLCDSTPVDLPPADRGVPALPQKDKEKKQHREHKKHKHKHKDKSKDKKDKKDGNPDSTADHKKHHDKKRKHERSAGDDPTDVHRRHKKSKVNGSSNPLMPRHCTVLSPDESLSLLLPCQQHHKSSKIDEVGVIRVAG